MTAATQSNPTSDDSEQVLWQGNFAARSLLGMWIGGLMVSGLAVLAVFRIETLRENQMVWLTLFVLLGLIWTGLIGLVLCRKLGQHYEITNFLLKRRSGIIVHRVRRIEMIDIDDVVYRQGPLQSLLNVGTIHLLTSDTSHPGLVMPGIRDVSSVANLIDEARRAERQKRGLSE